MIPFRKIGLSWDKPEVVRAERMRTAPVAKPTKTAYKYLDVPLPVDLKSLGSICVEVFQIYWTFAEVKVFISQQAVANTLGVHRSTVSRALKKLIDNGFMECVDSTFCYRTDPEVGIKPTCKTYKSWVKEQYFENIAKCRAIEEAVKREEEEYRRTVNLKNVRITPEAEKTVRNYNANYSYFRQPTREMLTEWQYFYELFKTRTEEEQLRHMSLPPGHPERVKLQKRAAKKHRLPLEHLSKRGIDDFVRLMKWEMLLRNYERGCFRKEAWRRLKQDGKSAKHFNEYFKTVTESGWLPPKFKGKCHSRRIRYPQFTMTDEQIEAEHELRDRGFEPDSIYD